MLRTHGVHQVQSIQCKRMKQNKLEKREEEHVYIVTLHDLLVVPRQHDVSYLQHVDKNKCPGRT